MAEQWYYTRQGRRFGPFSLEQARQLAQAGQLQQSDLVWTEGMAEWTPASRFAQLFPPAAPVSVPGTMPVAMSASVPGMVPPMALATAPAAAARAESGPFDFLDVSFNRFVGPTIVRWLWMLYLILMPVAFVLSALWAVRMLRGGDAIGFIVAEALGLALLTLLVRLGLEMVWALFQITEYLREMRQAQRADGTQ